MADIIQWSDWSNLSNTLEATNQAVSGMSASEASQALNTTSRSGFQVVNSSNAINEATTELAYGTASEAMETYIESGGATTSSGSATTFIGNENTANLTLYETTAGVSAGGLLALNLPSAVAAIAPIAGLAIGVGFWEIADPTLIDNLKNEIQEYFYEDTELIPAVVSSDGTTYIDENVVDLIKNFLQNNTKTTTVTSELTTNIPQPIYVYNRIKFTTEYSNYVQENEYILDNCRAIFYDNHDNYYNGYFIAPITESSRTINFTYNYKVYNKITGEVTENSVYRTQGTEGTVTINNKVAGIFKFNVDNRTVQNFPYYIYSLTPDDNSKWSVIYGIIEESGLPLDIWEGENYPSETEDINIYIGDKPSKPYKPVALPIGDNPYETNDPLVQPNPATNPNPAPAVEPWISPSPNPSTYPATEPLSNPADLPNPVPTPVEESVPAPTSNPSQPIDTPPSNPNNVTTPTDTGNGSTPTIPVIPSLPSKAMGLLHVYNPTQAQIDAFGQWLWTTFSGDLIEVLSKLFNNPMDAVIGLHELYATPSLSGSSTIRAGYLDSGVTANYVGSRYTEINCGNVIVEEYYRNYLDYSPYTKCYIYLPFIGIVPVSADDIVGNAVNITYHIDSYTGCCIAVISVAKKGYSSTVYQFEGNCAVEIPITSGYQSAMVGALLTSATAITGAGAGVAMMAGNIGRASLSKNEVQHSGQFGSSYGAMGCKKPYIIVKRVTQKIVNNYSESYGYPAHKLVYVGNCEGYLRAREVRVLSTTATNVEKEMILNALKEGVYVK